MLITNKTSPAAAAISVDRIAHLMRSACMLFVSFPALADIRFQVFQLALAQDLRLRHAADQLFDGAFAKAIDDLAHGARREAAGRLHGSV